MNRFGTPCDHPGRVLSRSYFPGTHKVWSELGISQPPPSTGLQPDLIVKYIPLAKDPYIDLAPLTRAPPMGSRRRSPLCLAQVRRRQHGHFDRGEYLTRNAAISSSIPEDKIIEC
jgi:hypothetical protein